MIHTGDANGLLMRPIAAGADRLRRLAYRDPGISRCCSTVPPPARVRDHYSILGAYPRSALWQDAAVWCTPAAASASSARGLSGCPASAVAPGGRPRSACQCAARRRGAVAAVSRRLDRVSGL